MILYLGGGGGVVWTSGLVDCGSLTIPLISCAIIISPTKMDIPLKRQVLSLVIISPALSSVL